MNLIVRLRNWSVTFSPRPAVRAARRAYFTAAEQAAATYDKLDTARSSQARARLLGDLAACERRMHDVYATAWITRDATDDDRQDAAAHATSAELLSLLASTEVSRSCQFRMDGARDWEVTFGHILDQLAEETSPAVRAELMVRLYLAAEPLVGITAAGTLRRVGDAYIRTALRNRPTPAVTALTDTATEDQS